MHFEKIKSSSITVFQCLKDIKEIVNLLDIYGNNALMLACVYHMEAKHMNKKKVIKYLLECGSNPNVRNKFTGFMPIHWCARYGELNNVKKLCEAGINPYIPDFEGHLPIDYAGKFEHWAVVYYLIHKTSKECKDKMKIPWKKMKNSKELYSRDEFILNPICRSTVLFWACYLPEEVFSW
jgi:ankyrin repeat protein